MENWICSWIKTTTADQHDLGGKSEEQIIRDGSAYLIGCFLTNPSWLGEDTERLAMLRLMMAMSVGGDGEAYESLASNFCLHRTFLTTTHGHMGLGPAGTQPGDFVVVLFGGGVPYILREQTTGWLFVGESYVDGYMCGKAIQAWRRAEVAEEVFELR